MCAIKQVAEGRCAGNRAVRITGSGIGKPRNGFAMLRFRCSFRLRGRDLGRAHARVPRRVHTNRFRKALAHLLAWRVAADHSGRRAVVDRGLVVDEIARYADLDLSARTVASALAEQLRPGDRALLLYPPGLDFIRAFFGCLYAGVIAVPASLPKPRGSLSRVEAVAADAGARVILTAGETLDRLDRLFVCGPALRQLSWVATDRLPAGASGARPIADLDLNTVAFLQCTSGTTSDPRA